MPIDRIHRILALLLSAILFLSTSGLPVDMHLCQGKLKRVNIFAKAKTCSQIAACKKACSKSQGSCTILGPSCGENDHSTCCKNKSMMLDMDYDYTHQLVKNPSGLNLDYYKPAIFALISFSNEVKITTVGNYYYRPPPNTKDYNLLYETFLI